MKKNIEVIKAQKNSRLKFWTLIYVADLAGCGTIRAIIPTILLNQFQSPQFEFNQFFLNKFVRDLNLYNNCVYTVFQRSATPQQLELIETYKYKISKLARSKAIYEVDDLLIGIPEWNYASNYYKKHESNIMRMLSIVDGITVSTEKLREVYSKYNENINIIPNHLPKMIWGEPNFVVQNNKKPVIMYPCSMNHFSLPGSKLSGGDIQGTFLNFIRKTVDVYDWNFIGGLPNELVDLKTQGKLKQHPWLSVYEYPAFLKSLKADVAIAPLVKNLFNECKSNIKVLEYVATGVPGVYTNIYPYYNCFQRADTDEEMIEKIEALIKSPDLRKQTWERDYASVKNQLFWEENNNLIEYFNQHLRLFGREIQFELG